MGPDARQPTTAAADKPCALKAVDVTASPYKDFGAKPCDERPTGAARKSRPYKVMKEKAEDAQLDKIFVQLADLSGDDYLCAGHAAFIGDLLRLPSKKKDVEDYLNKHSKPRRRTPAPASRNAASGPGARTPTPSGPRTGAGSATTSGTIGSDQNVKKRVPVRRSYDDIRGSQSVMLGPNDNCTARRNQGPGGLPRSPNVSPSRPRASPVPVAKKSEGPASSSAPRTAWAPQANKGGSNRLPVKTAPNTLRAAASRDSLRPDSGKNTSPSVRRPSDGSRVQSIAAMFGGASQHAPANSSTAPGARNTLPKPADSEKRLRKSSSTAVLSASRPISAAVHRPVSTATLLAPARPMSQRFSHVTPTTDSDHSDDRLRNIEVELRKVQTELAARNTELSMVETRRMKERDESLYHIHQIEEQTALHRSEWERELAAARLQAIEATREADELRERLKAQTDEVIRTAAEVDKLKVLLEARKVADPAISSDHRNLLESTAQLRTELEEARRSLMDLGLVVVEKENRIRDLEDQLERRSSGGAPSPASPPQSGTATPPEIPESVTACAPQPPLGLLQIARYPDRQHVLRPYASRSALSSPRSASAPSPPATVETPAVETDINADWTLADTFLANTERPVENPLVHLFDASRQELQRFIPSNKLDVTILTHLYLDHNGITIFPECIAQMRQLVLLNLDFNRISHIPTAVEKLTELRELCLSNNCIFDMSESVGSLRKLEYLDLSHNSLATLPFTLFSQMESLGSLDLSYNRFEHLPPSLGLCYRSLKGLSIAGNPIAPKSLSGASGEELKLLMANVDEAKAALEPKTPAERVAHAEKAMRRLNSAAQQRNNLNRMSYGSSMSVDTTNSGPDGEGRDRDASSYRFDSFDSGGSLSALLIKEYSTTNRLRCEGPAEKALQRQLLFLRDVYDLNPVTNAGKLPSNAELRSSDSPTLQSPPDSSGGSLPRSLPAATVTQPDRRRSVVMELLTTEQTYVRELHNVHDIYVSRFSSWLGSREMDLIFGNLASIFMIHRDHLLPGLVRQRDVPGQPLGELFLTIVPYMKMYSTYYNNLDASTSFIAHLGSTTTSSGFFGSSTSNMNNTLTRTSTSSSASSTRSSASSIAAPSGALMFASIKKPTLKKIRTFLKHARAHPQHTQISLQAFLLLPVQRLPRYKLLLESLLGCTGPEHEDFDPLCRAVDQVRARVAECNENKRAAEDREAALAVTARIVIPRDDSYEVLGADSVRKVPSTRRLVREGPVKVVKMVQRVNTGNGLDVTANPMGAPGPMTPTSPGRVITTADVEELALDGVDDEGRDAYWFLFSDLLCWCKAGRRGQNTHELIRAMDVNGAEALSPTTARVRGDGCVLYVECADAQAWALSLNTGRL
ncbi:hypothetical protein HDU89_007506 [Geranomyces variabilis]|nr:hypothetical protein HDU89_007506 [Geranomyces variabilis]